MGWRGVAVHQRLLMMLQSVKEADLAAFFKARGRQRQRPPNSKQGHILQPLACLAPGEGKGGAKGAKRGQRGTFSKKSQKQYKKKVPPS